MKLNTFKTAYVSDLHVTANDRLRLENGTSGYLVAERETGWVINVDVEPDYEAPMSDAFLELMRLAFGQDCEYVELCSYASPTEGLAREDLEDPS